MVVERTSAESSESRYYRRIMKDNIDVEEIIRLKKKGLTGEQIADKLGLTITTVYCQINMYKGKHPGTQI